MLLTITTTRRPATDLGWLLHKHPAKAQTFELAFGRAHVFYPEAGEDRCTAAMVLDVDPIGLVRKRRGFKGEGFSLQQYVNDRPYVASSFMSVAIAQVFGTALGGRCKDRPELVDCVLPLDARIAVLPCRGGEGFLRRLFEPLGYEVSAESHVLDTKFGDWGDSDYFTVTLRGEQRLQDLLAHLYVLIPVLDNEKHYWVGQDELEKLLRQGEGWLAKHPGREAISTRYLKYQRRLAREAIARLAEEDRPDPDADEAAHELEEAALEATVYVSGGDVCEGICEGDGAGTAGDAKSVANVAAGSEVAGMRAAEATADSTDESAQHEERGPTLNTQRLATVLAVLRGSGAKSVVDLGCGEGRLLRMLLEDKNDATQRAGDTMVKESRAPTCSDHTRCDAGREEPRASARVVVVQMARGRRFDRIVGMDVSLGVLKIASERLRLDRLPPTQRKRIELMHGSLTYRDGRLAGFDAAACVEVIEHLDASRLAAFERVLFEFARPKTVVITTPNREYNVRFESLPAGQLRHRDHRFEWTRAEFETWASTTAERFGYSVRFLPIGPVDAEVGSPTQMGVFQSDGDSR